MDLFRRRPKTKAIVVTPRKSVADLATTAAIINRTPTFSAPSSGSNGSPEPGSPESIKIHSKGVVVEVEWESALTDLGMELNLDAMGRHVVITRLTDAPSSSGSSEATAAQRVACALKVGDVLVAINTSSVLSLEYDDVQSCFDMLRLTAPTHPHLAMPKRLRFLRSEHSLRDYQQHLQDLAPRDRDRFGFARSKEYLQQERAYQMSPATLQAAEARDLQWVQVRSPTLALSLLSPPTLSINVHASHPPTLT